MKMHYANPVNQSWSSANSVCACKRVVTPQTPNFTLQLRTFCSTPASQRCKHCERALRQKLIHAITAMACDINRHIQHTENLVYVSQLIRDCGGDMCRTWLHANEMLAHLTYGD